MRPSVPATGNRRNQSQEVLDLAIVSALRALPTAILSDNMAGLVGTSALRPMHKEGRMVGTAVTVRVRPGDNLVLHRSLDYVRPGDVLVVDGGGDLRQAVTGKIMLTYLEHIGAAGLVLDGAIRGAAEIASRTFPCFARGVTCKGPYKHGPGEINITISIDGMPVAPGDIVVGDWDGVVAFPREDAVSLIERATRQAEKEAAGVEAIRQGRWDRSWIADAERKQGLIDE
jgi:regulator of RNase E activity RraA